MPIHNKLVRDNIPNIIKQNGKKATYHVLSESEYLIELDKKLNEECNEYYSDKSLEELADILEVIYSIAQARGYSIDELEALRLNKANERGAFSKRIFLENVLD